jgi:hypothetical protein
LWHPGRFPEIHGELNPLDIEPFTVNGAGTIHFVVPDVSVSKRARLSLTLIDGAGQTAAENFAGYRHPAHLPAPNGGLKIYAPELAHRMEELGLQSCDQPGRRATGGCTTAHTIHISLPPSGRSGLVAGRKRPGAFRCFYHVADQTSAAALTGRAIGPVPLVGSQQMGHSSTCHLAWRTVDFIFAGITPDHVISGVTPDEFGTGVHAGLFVGWLQHNAALVPERRMGEGRLLISTFQLSENLNTNPLAAAMLMDLVRITWLQMHIEPSHQVCSIRRK